MAARPVEDIPGRGLALIGPRGSGKTTVGRIVAARLGRAFFDADSEIEARAGCSVRRIFEEEGEPAFRDREQSTLRDLVRDAPGSVIATGGGAILRESNRRALASHGLVAWLAAPADVLAERLSRDGGDRPALTADGLLGEIAPILAAREPLYRAAADFLVDASRPEPEAVADEVVRALLAGSADRGRR